MANRERGVKINFWVTPEEQKLIEGKMEKASIRNMSAYLRKLAIDGYIVRLDVPELRELLTQAHLSEYPARPQNHKAVRQRLASRQRQTPLHAR